MNRLPPQSQLTQGRSQLLPPFDPEIVSDDEREFAQDVTRRLMMGYSWTGRLPRPNDLRQYDEIVPGAAAKLVDDVVYETRLAEQSIAIDKEVSTRVLSIMESQHTLEVEESRSDRQFREKVFGSIRYLLYLPLAVILIVVFAPLSDWVKATVVLGILAAYVVPLCIVLLKGRMTEPEKDAISTVVPAVVAAVTSVLRSQSDKEQSPVRKLPQLRMIKALEDRMSPINRKHLFSCPHRQSER
jgi:uncharacterized membrane protein